MEHSKLINIALHLQKRVKGWRYVRFDVLNALQNPSSVSFLHAYEEKVKSISVKKIIALIKYSLDLALKLPVVRRRHIFLIPKDYWQESEKTYFLFEKLFKSFSAKDIVILEIPSGENFRLSRGHRLLTISAMPLFLGDYITRPTTGRLWSQDFKEFNVTFDQRFYDFLNSKLRKSKARQKSISLFLTLIRPRTITLVSAYDSTKICFIESAKKLGIQTIEVQHGHIYPNHVGYAFSSLDGVDITPSIYLVWNKFYKHILQKNGVKSDKIIIVGSLFASRSADFLTQKEEPHKLLIINQYTMTNELVDILNQCRSTQLPKLYIKPHPRFKDEQIRTLKGRLRCDFEILDTESRVIDIACDFDSVLGFYSTALIEALIRGVPTYVMEMPTMDHFNDLIEAGYLKSISSLNEIYLSKSAAIKFVPDFNESSILAPYSLA